MTEKSNEHLQIEIPSNENRDRVDSKAETYDEADRKDSMVEKQTPLYDDTENIPLCNKIIFEFLGTWIVSTACNILELVPVNIRKNYGIEQPLPFICLLYFTALIITIPISGGYLNPAITISAWIGNSEAQKLYG